MNAKELFNDYPYDLLIEGIETNSKLVEKNYIFISTNNKKEYINEAIKNGAVLIIGTEYINSKNYIHRDNIADEIVRLYQLFYKYRPSIYTVGVTGTDGKTTVATLVNQILNFDNKSCYIGTNGIKFNNTTYKTHLTTPKPKVIYKVYRNLLNNDATDLVMEVSSEGLADNRCKDFSFCGAIFTNLSHEHLNTHKTMLEYFKTKSALFESLPKYGLAVINNDDRYSKLMRYYTNAHVITYGIKGGDYQAKNISIGFCKTTFDLYFKDHYITEINTNLFGIYNVYNTLAAIAYTLELGIPLEIVKSQLIKLRKINGRFEVYKKNKITTIVDFAHTPNGIYQVLSNIQLIPHKRVITVVGSQGAKDSTKRPIIGKVACIFSDIVIFTSEDPKDESIFDILLDLTKKCSLFDYYISLSRKDAIKLAYEIASENDIVMIFGKGNEEYEEINGYLFKHNDMKYAKYCQNNKALGFNT